MAVNVKNKDSISLGNGILYIGTTGGTFSSATTNVGLLLNDVTFNYSVEMLRLEAGTPVMLVKQAKSKETATIQAELCELTPDNIQLMMGIGDSYVTYVTPNYKIGFGGAPGAMPELPIKFIHTRPDGHTIVVYFNKAQTTGTIDFAFTDGAWISTQVTFEALSATTVATGFALGYLLITK